MYKHMSLSLGVLINESKFVPAVDDYAKMADKGWSDLHVAFTVILHGTNFCIW